MQQLLNRRLFESVFLYKSFNNTMYESQKVYIKDIPNPKQLKSTDP